jgi:hypothetical protein
MERSDLCTSLCRGLIQEIPGVTQQQGQERLDVILWGKWISVMERTDKFRHILQWSPSGFELKDKTESRM